MAKIPVYNNQLFPNPEPMARAASSAATYGYYRGRMIEGAWNNLGQGVQAAYSALTKKDTEAQRAAEQDDIASLTEGVATANADLTTAWQTRAASYDPGDTEHDVQQDFFENDFNKRYDTFKPQTEKGRQYLEKAKARSYAHFWTSTSADVANAKGKWGVDQANNIFTKNSTAIQADPSMWKSIVAQSDEAVNALDDAHGFGPVKKAELTTKWNHDYAITAAKQMIYDDAELGSEAINKGDFDQYISGSEKLMLMKEADKEAHSQHQAKLTEDASDLRAKERVAQQQINELQASVPMSADGKLEIPKDYDTKLTAILRTNADALSPDAVRSARNWAAANIRRTLGHEKQVQHNDPDTDKALFNKQLDGTLTPGDVDEANAKGLITVETWKKYRKGLNDATKAQTKAEAKVRGSLEKWTGLIAKTYPNNELAQQATSNYVEDMLHEWEDMQSKGKTFADLQQYAAIQAGHYFSGKDHAATIIQKHVQENAPAPNPDNARKSGESAEDYLKRRGL